MNVTVTLQDNTTLSPIFDPSHKEAVLGFYKTQAFYSQIKNYVVRDNSGVLVAFGGKF